MHFTLTIVQKRLPSRRASYALELALGFIVSVVFCLLVGSLLGSSVSLPPFLLGRIAIMFTVIVYIIDLVRYSPRSESGSGKEINRFQYFTLGPYQRFFAVANSKNMFSPLAKIVIVLIFISIPLSLYIIERLESQAFLGNSEVVVTEMSDSFSDLKDCKKLDDCPKEFEDLANVIRSYAIPSGAKGYAMIVSKDNGIYKAIASEGRDELFRIHPRLKPIGSKEDPPLSSSIFKPLFNRDFSQLISTFKSDGNSSIEIASIDTFGRSSRLKHLPRFFRSLHPVSVNGKRMVVYITSGQDFLLTPLQKRFSRQ